MWPGAMEWRRLAAVTIAGVEKEQGRLFWVDGTFSDTVVLRCGPERLRLRDIDQPDLTVKLRTAAQLRYVKARGYGRAEPSIIAFGCLTPDQPAGKLFPGVPATSDEGEVLLSANSLLSYTLRGLLDRGWLRRQGGGWQVVAPASEPAWQARGQAIVDLLERRGRLLLYRGPGQPLPDELDFAGFSAGQDLIPVGPLGFVRDLVWREAPLAAFNTAYFLLEHDDWLSHHSSLGEAFNLFIEDGVIRRPPLYRRSTLCQTSDGFWRIEKVGLDDIALTLPNGTRLVPAGRPEAGPALPFHVDKAAEVTLYTRRFGIAGQGRVLSRTPQAAGRFEIAIVDRRVAGWKRDGGLELPQNGLVVSFAPGALGRDRLRDLQQAPVAWQPVTYEFAAPDLLGLRQAIQVGPRLLRDGQICLDAGSLAREAFWITRTDEQGRRQIGVAPTDYPDDVDQTRAGRCAIGIDRAGRLLLGAISSTETGVAHVKRPYADSSGATLLEIAQLLQEAGALEAVNLDGGGSTQVFFAGGAATTPGNRLGLPGVAYERMVPAIGVVR